MPEQKKAGKPVPGPSAISARGGKFRQLPGEPGYVAVRPHAIPNEIKNDSSLAYGHRRPDRVHSTL